MLETALIVGAFALAGGTGVLWRRARRAERRLREAIQAMPVALAVFDPQDQLEFWNALYEANSGPCLDELKRGISFREMLRWDLKAGHYREARGRERDWLHNRLQLRAEAKGAHEQHLDDDSWLRIEDRRTTEGGIVTICTDITDLKRREASFKLLFDNNPVPMWLWEGGRSLRVLDLNQAALDHLGYSRDDIGRLSVYDLLADDEKTALQEMLSTGVYRPYYGERIWRPKRADGTLRSALPYIHILPQASGAPHFIGAIVDVTERVAAEDELRRTAETLAVARDAAEAANRAKSEFLANMSHELRTPLNGIVGLAELLAKADLGPREREIAETIRNSGLSLERLLSDVLDLARMDSGRLEVETARFHLGDVVRSVGTLIGSKAMEKGVAFRMEVDPAIDGPTEGDGSRVKQILAQLIANAIKFTDRGEIVVRATAAPEGVRLSVADTGVGFDPADRDRIFGRFEQADGSITRRYGGSGLGLSISRELAELMGGSLEAEGAKGQGATFTLSLPLQIALQTVIAGPSPAITATAEVSEPTERALRILVVDDHPTNRKVVELILAGAGAELVSAENGLEGLEAYQAEPFDVVLMDMQMPVMDGLTATARIREHELAKGLHRAPVLMLTANALPEHVRAAAEAGADRHISKPITPDGLLSAISDALDQAAERAAA
ncbi:MAG: response regulator [Proteobacteria bacterium]|nr:response regulator [Pseudomonadota bacterium]